MKHTIITSCEVQAGGHLLTISLRVLLYVVSNSVLSQITLQEISLADLFLPNLIVAWSLGMFCGE